jgi:hypothetical protein
MPFNDDKIVAKLAHIAKTVAAGECENKKRGQPECPEQHLDRDNWCLVCIARAALADYFK